jgi:hypothetical protein
MLSAGTWRTWDAPTDVCRSRLKAWFPGILLISPSAVLTCKDELTAVLSSNHGTARLPSPPHSSKLAVCRVARKFDRSCHDALNTLEIILAVFLYVVSRGAGFGAVEESAPQGDGYKVSDAHLQTGLPSADLRSFSSLIRNINQGKMQFTKLALIVGLYATSAAAIWCGYVIPVSRENPQNPPTQSSLHSLGRRSGERVLPARVQGWLLESRLFPELREAPELERLRRPASDGPVCPQCQSSDTCKCKCHY